MMTRLCLCLLLACASASLAAREVKHSSPNSGSCTDTATVNAQAVTPKAKGPVAQTPAPVRHEPRPRATVSSDPPARPPVRWHSFLPGMFR